jgi:hypothetical protein
MGVQGQEVLLMGETDQFVEGIVPADVFADE